MKRLTKHFALCLKNKGNEASLILGKVYRVVSDARAAKDDLVRIIDESGVLGQRSVGLRAGGDGAFEHAVVVGIGRDGVDGLRGRDTFANSAMLSTASAARGSDHPNFPST